MEIVDMFWDIIPILIVVLFLAGIYAAFLNIGKSDLKSYYLTPDEVEALKQYRMSKKNKME